MSRDMTSDKIPYRDALDHVWPIGHGDDPIRAFVEWCATLDEPGNEGITTIRRIAMWAREALKASAQCDCQSYPGTGYPHRDWCRGESWNANPSQTAASVTFAPRMERSANTPPAMARISAELASEASTIEAISEASGDLLIAFRRYEYRTHGVSLNEDACRQILHEATALAIVRNAQTPLEPGA